MAGSGVITSTGDQELDSVFGTHALALELQAQYADKPLYASFLSDHFADQEWFADLSASSKVTYSVYVKPVVSDGSASADFSFSMLTGFYGTTTEGSTVHSVPFGEWTRVWVTCDVPADGNLGDYMYAQLKFDQGFPDGVNKVRFLLDGALLEPSEKPLPYFDGSFDGAEWLGTPHLSVSKGATPFTPYLQVTPDEANHRAIILTVGRSGYRVTVYREVSGGLPNIVRGIDDITLDLDERLFFDYEIPQGDNVVYRAVFTDPGGEETITPPAEIEPQDYKADLIFPLNDPLNGLKLIVQEFRELTWGVSQEVLKVWNRPDPIVVSGVREYPRAMVMFVTETDRDRRRFLQILNDGGVVGFNPRKSDTGFDGIAYFNLGEVKEKRIVPRASDPLRRWEAQVQQVVAPPADWPYPTGIGETWGELKRTDDDWSIISDELWVDVLDFGGEELADASSERNVQAGAAD